MNDTIIKKIKKNIYGKLQRIKILFPAGFSETAGAEVQFILNNLWFPQKGAPSFSILKNALRVDDIHMISIMELLMRSQCLSDIQLVICETKAFGKSAFKKKCEEIEWDFFINKKMSLNIHVNSIASQAFHESGLKEILSDVIKEKVQTVDDNQSTTTLFVNLYKNKLTLSISLAGDKLYKRGYRGVLSASAPLREDAAACCIQKAFKFAQKYHENFSPELIVIPFSGTGTFVFEFLQHEFQLSSVLFGREYALQKMPLFKKESFNFLLKKAKENCLPVDEKNVQIICMDTSTEANAALKKNISQFETAMAKNGIQFTEKLFSLANSDDFFSFELKNPGNIFIPLNPPYGIRLNKKSNAVTLYQSIAHKINQIAQKNKKPVLGFILCPTEETWSAFCKIIKAQMETYHFTQGGMDIRVCQFYI